MGRRCNKGKADRFAHDVRTMHSPGAILGAHVKRAQEIIDQIMPTGGPVTHLTCDEYMAKKITEAIIKLER